MPRKSKDSKQYYFYFAICFFHPNCACVTHPYCVHLRFTMYHSHLELNHSPFNHSLINGQYHSLQLFVCTTMLLRTLTCLLELYTQNTLWAGCLRIELLGHRQGGCSALQDRAKWFPQWWPEPSPGLLLSHICTSFWFNRLQNFDAFIFETYKNSAQDFGESKVCLLEKKRSLIKLTSLTSH